MLHRFTMAVLPVIADELSSSCSTIGTNATRSYGYRKSNAAADQDVSFLMTSFSDTLTMSSHVFG
jgi:hypothetical protein